MADSFCLLGARPVATGLTHAPFWLVGLGAKKPMPPLRCEPFVTSLNRFQNGHTLQTLEGLPPRSAVLASIQPWTVKTD